ncbi:hypothetical protein IWQ62_005540 [Dispira parvispora]|uniref:CBS domain-containing protein n=1 Tax=Dispira parvispora TaxID=1520584 RepID=A0A9W8AJT1_9FUNG|nr:hypothetical protein IWQ62_005540 [Dispira parvispora]
MKSLKELTPADLKPWDPAHPVTTDEHMRLRRRRLIVASPTITVAEALDMLASNNIISLPIYSHYVPGKIVNIVNIRDILAYTTSLPNPQGDNSSQADPTKGSVAVPESWKEKLESNIESVMTLDATKESYRFLECDIDENIGKVMKAFSSGIHRALVCAYPTPDAKSPNPSFLLTQSDMVYYISKHPDVVPKEILDHSVQALFPEAFSRTLLTVRAQDPTLHALRYMDHNDRTAAAVLDHEGRLVGNISASDLRGLRDTNLGLLQDPVMQFLDRIRPQRPSPVVTTRDGTLGYVIEQVCNHKIHRVWVVDDERRPVAVVTLTDIIGLLDKRL